MSCIELRVKTATLWLWINGIELNGARGGATLLIWLSRTGPSTGSPPDWEVMIEHVTVRSTA